MGVNSTKQQRVIPDKGYRINGITKKALTDKIDIMSDYILSPDPKSIDLRKPSIRFQIYSILTAEVRSVELPIANRELGLQLRLEEINDCVLRITKIFHGSPFSKYGVEGNQFIVGLIQGEFSCIKSFAELVKKLTVLNPKGVLSLGVCNHEGKTRIVSIPISELKEWGLKGRGLLGCELAEGWIHRWKPFKRKNDLPEGLEKKAEETLSQKPIEIPQIKNMSIEQQQSANSGSSDQIDQKCDSLNQKYNNETSSYEVKFKGFLKGEQMIDSSGICRCKPKDNECEKCFIQKDGSYYFFNRKTNRIMEIPIKMMLNIDE